MSRWRSKPPRRLRRPTTPPGVSVRDRPDFVAHWHLSVDGAVATLTMDVDEQRGLRPGYAEAQLRTTWAWTSSSTTRCKRFAFEHPRSRAWSSPRQRTVAFRRAPNIGMLAQATHPWKVNFCKFTTKRVLEMEDAERPTPGQTISPPVNGPPPAGDTSWRSACDEILLIDERIVLRLAPRTAAARGTARTQAGLTRSADKRQCSTRSCRCFIRAPARGRQGADRTAFGGLVDAAIARGQFQYESVSVASRIDSRRNNPVRRRRRALRSSRSQCRPGKDGIAYDHVSRCPRTGSAGVGHAHNRRTR